MPVIPNPYKAGRFGTIHSPWKGLSDDKLYWCGLDSESNGIECIISREPTTRADCQYSFHPTLDVRLRYTFLQAG